MFLNRLSYLPICVLARSRTQGFVESDDVGEHLTAVVDLLQKHSLLEQDIKINEERIKSIELQSEEFLAEQGTDSGECTNPHTAADDISFIRYILAYLTIVCTCMLSNQNYLI